MAKPLLLSVSARAGDNRRRNLERLLRFCALIAAAAIVWVIVDFSIDIRPPGIHSSYRFSLAELAPDEARILRQDNLSILVIRRSAATIRELEQAPGELQDPDSSDSRQPDYARNPLRSREAEYFVSYAIGTDLGCLLQIGAAELLEACGSARYDFAGRAFKSAETFPNLTIPDYTFTNNFSTLTIKP